MPVHLPLEILSIIFTDLFQNLIQEKQPNEAVQLLLVSRTVRAILEPLLYRKIDIYNDGTKNARYRRDKATNAKGPLLYRTLRDRPKLADHVKEFSIDDEDSSDEYESEPESEKSEEDEDDPGCGSDETNPIVKYAKSMPKPKAVAGEEVEGEGLPPREGAHWLLPGKFSNLVSLTLNVQSGLFGKYVPSFQFPHLREFSFTADMGNEGSWAGPLEPEEILESIISATGKLETLTFEDMRSVSFPTTFDADDVKRILNHAAGTLRSLSLVLAINDEKDWRLPQECTDLDGCFESMRNFEKLTNLSIQMELLLGKPEDGLRLKDVLPLGIEDITFLVLHDYNGSDEERIWEYDNYIPQFQELAEVAESGEVFGELGSVNVYQSRRDEFSSPNRGRFEEGFLAESRVYFGYY